MGKLTKVNHMSKQKYLTDEKQLSSIHCLETRKVKDDEEKLSGSVQSTSLGNYSDAVVTPSKDPILSIRTDLKHSYFNRSNRLRTVAHPSNNSLHYRQHHHHRRKALNTNTKKTIPYPTYQDEENAFDADVEDSDTTPEVNYTTITLGTSKSSTMSYESDEKHYRCQKLVQKELITPPRGFIHPYELMECSPLSLSFHSMSSSSISGDSIPRETEIKSGSLRGKKNEPFDKIPRILSIKPFRERMICLVKNEDSGGQTTMNTKAKDMIQDFDRCNKMQSTKDSKQKWKLTFRLTKGLIFRLTLVILVYSIATVVMTTKKLLHHQVDDKILKLNIFKSRQIQADDPVLRFEYEDQDRHQTAILQGDTKVIIKRVLGGLHSIQTFEEKAQKFDKPSRCQSCGLGQLDVKMYDLERSHVVQRNKRPRIFRFYRIGNNPKRHVVRELTIYPTPFSDNTQLYGIRDSADPALSQMEPIVEDQNAECTPIAEWQSTYHPSCNGIHELDLGFMNDVKLIGKKGYWRNAWKISVDSSQRIETMILKTPKFDHNFEQAYYEHDRVDAQAMERQTFSPHIINIYSFCGRSVMTEFADGPRLGTLVDKARKRPLKRLEIARDIAVGLSHVHYGRQGENATFVHLDVNPANIVVVNNTLKLNDFNIGIMLKRNNTSGLQCGFPAQFPNPQWRSPEEANGSMHLNEKVDVFSMGHIFFRMICGHEPWNKLELGGKPSSSSLQEKVKAGILPRIPNHIMNTTIMEERIILDAMLASYTLNPDERPSSRDIAEFLDYELTNLVRGGKYKFHKQGKK